MKILALDPATKFGFAHSSGPAGTWDLSIRRDESRGMRLIRLHGKLTEILQGVGVDLVVFEAARNAGPKMQGALVVQAELQGVLVLWCEQRKIEYKGVSPSEVKKHATGKGNANKHAMIAAAKKRWPDAIIEDDNMADALWILDMAQTQIVGAVPAPAPQKQLIPGEASLFP
jgi:Holliday junction resolvasome RuvABC endonuclease subunit